MPKKPEPIPADPDDAEDFDACSADVSRALLGREVRLLRQETTLSQRAFADRYGIAVGTLRDWEQARAAPPLYAVAFLRIAVRGGEADEEVGRIRAMVA